ncbi:FAD-dependent oxidoreductase, partial [Enterococcus faecalis]
LPVLPKEIIFIGGGYIAFELATIANAAGSKVTIVHHNQRPLKEFEASLVEEAVHQMEASGIQFAFGVETQKIISEGTRYRLVGKETELVADMIFCATGRQPNTESLALEQANIVFDKHGIAVNDYLQTSNPKIFACGDIVSRKTPKLTPV